MEMKTLGPKSGLFLELGTGCFLTFIGELLHKVLNPLTPRQAGQLVGHHSKKASWMHTQHLLEFSQH